MRPLAILLVLFWALPLRAAAPDPAFHLYLLIGQSNMAGRGKLEEMDKQPHARLLHFTKENKWAPAVDPIHFDKPIAGVGLGRTFGLEMLKGRSDATLRIGLIPCAVGGTPISRWQKGADLYEAALRRARAAMKEGVIQGVLWHQGESDSGKAETAQAYAKNLDAMIAALRKDLDQPTLPVIVGQLGEFYREGANVTAVNDALQTLPKRVPHAAFIPSRGLGHKGDQVHFDAPAYREFGRRYAAAMLQLQAPPAKK
jgi:hypothetical protein